jgi:hypothetical protein
VADDVRADLEHTPQRKPFDVDEARCLDALRFCWGDAYETNTRSGTWTAKRRDGLGGDIEASLPDDLSRLIREDWALKPVLPPAGAGGPARPR